MAVTIDPTSLLLVDGFPGPIAYNLPPADPSGDVFGNATHCNVVAAAYPIGTKVAYYDITNSGWSIMTYLQYDEGAGAVVEADGQLCGVHLSSAVATPNVVTSDGDSANQSYFGAAVQVLSMTDAYFGWFWTGGVCPSDKAPNIAAATGVIISETNDVTGGNALEMVDSGENVGLDVAATGSILPIVAFALTIDNT